MIFELHVIWLAINAVNAVFVLKPDLSLAFLKLCSHTRHFLLLKWIFGNVAKRLNTDHLNEIKLQECIVLYSLTERRVIFTHT